MYRLSLFSKISLLTLHPVAKLNCCGQWSMLGLEAQYIKKEIGPIKVKMDLVSTIHGSFNLKKISSLVFRFSNVCCDQKVTKPSLDDFFKK